VSINLEQIDQVRERANVSYEVAKEALENNNNDVLEALIYLEKQNKGKTYKKLEAAGTSFADTMKGLVKKGNENKLTIKKDDNTVVNIPVNAAVVTTVLAAPVAAVGLAAALITKHKVKIEKPDGGDLEINKAIDKVSDAVNTASEKVIEAFKKHDDYNL
jgi:NACalpha-BTF3-like transcription factor